MSPQPQRCVRRFLSGRPDRRSLVVRPGVGFAPRHLAWPAARGPLTGARWHSSAGRCIPFRPHPRRPLRPPRSHWRRIPGPSRLERRGRRSPAASIRNGSTSTPMTAPPRSFDAPEAAGTQFGDRCATADLEAPALGVSWAGADPAPGWLGIAREFGSPSTGYTDTRSAMPSAAPPARNRTPCPRSWTPSLRALPHTLRHTAAPVGAQMEVIVEGPAAGGPPPPPRTARHLPDRPPVGRPPRCSWIQRPPAPVHTWHRSRHCPCPSPRPGEHRPAEAVCGVVSLVC